MPWVVLLSGLILSVVYVLAVAGILLAVPLSELSLVTGTWDALVVLGRQWGTGGATLVRLLGIGFLYACVVNIVTWSLGTSRVAAAAANEGMLPAVFSRLHPRHNTPYMAFVIMGALSTLLLLGNAALASSAANVFWMIFKLSSLCFLISYLMMFPAFLILRRRQPAHPRPYRMPGGSLGAWVAAVVCWIIVATTCLLFFKPAPSAQHAARETWLLAAETLITLGAGLALIPRSKRTG